MPPLPSGQSVNLTQYTRTSVFRQQPYQSFFLLFTGASLHFWPYGFPEDQMSFSMAVFGLCLLFPLVDSLTSAQIPHHHHFLPESTPLCSLFSFSFSFLFFFFCHFNFHCLCEIITNIYVLVSAPSSWQRAPKILGNRGAEGLFCSNS